MKHEDYMKKYENDPEYLKGVIEMLRAENNLLKKMARSLINKLNLIQESKEYIGIFQMAQIHGLDYRGETYTKEYDALISLLETYIEE